MHKTVLIVLAVSLAFAGQNLSAQNLTGGLLTGFSAPVGDLKDKQFWGTGQSLGYHFGGFLDFNLTTNHQIRTSLTYQAFPGSKSNVLAGFYLKSSISDLQLGADWLYHFEGTGKGWYSLAGVSLNNMRNERDYALVIGTVTNPQVIQATSTETQNGRIGFRAGVGYSFTKSFSFEGTLNQVLVEKTGNSGFGFNTANWAQFSVAYHF
jgi:hypothetical protein